jgi:hypothetical protein
LTFDEWKTRHPVAYAELASCFTPVTPTDKGGSESRVESEVTLDAVKYGALWRNNAGAADLNGQPVRFGLGNVSQKFWKNWRSGDRVGITRVQVQPHHVGRVFGIFTMCEIKAPGFKKPTDDRERAQANCLANVSSLDGMSSFVSSVSDYHEMIRRYIA